MLTPFDIAKIQAQIKRASANVVAVTASASHTHSQLHDRSHAMTSASDHVAGNWKMFHSNGAGAVVELPLGASGQVLQSNGATSAPTFVTPVSDPSSAFSVNKNGTAQNFVTAAPTKLTWSAEDFDVGSEFASSTFTPVSPGKYLLECAARVTAIGTSTTAMRLHIYKNGALLKTLMHVIAIAGLTDITLEGSTLVAAVATDTFDAYVEFAGLTAGTATISGAVTDTFFSGVWLTN